jgi:NAD(P)-dependent dehydrogenase (short-subunit alcohol dehydrogenase family)
MKIAGSKVLVTGGNRGLGAALVTALHESGCAKIYVGARDPVQIVPGKNIHPVRLDITDAAQVEEAGRRCSDVDLLINNAGIAEFIPLIGASEIGGARREMETNYFGTLQTCRAFAPVLKRNGGGGLVNVLSVASWIGVPMQGSYCASKAAAWALTRSIRFELRAQRTLVSGVFVGYIDTDMTAGLPYPKVSARQVANEILAGVEQGREEILADERARALRAQLFADLETFDANMQKTWDGLKLA